MTDRQKKADRFYLAGKVGAIAFAVWMLLYLWANHVVPILPDPMQSPGLLARDLVNFATMVSLGWAFITLVLLRKSDEFTLAIWHNATTSGFFTSIIWLFFVPLFIGVFTLLSGDTERPDYDAMITTWGAAVVMAAFFIGFHLKRFKR